MEYNLENILPHNHPMILIDKLEEVNMEEGYVCASTTITPDKIFFDNTLDGIDSYVGIEFMAQTLACFSYFKFNQKSPKIGFLLGTRSYKCSLEKFETGKTYLIKAKELYSDSELVSFECFIYNNGEVVANATVNAYQPDNAEEFLKTGFKENG